MQALVFMFFWILALALKAQQPSIDLSYGEASGFSFLRPGPGGDHWLNHHLTDAHDRTYMAGRMQQNGDDKIMILRLDAEGKLDSSFNGLGYALLNVRPNGNESLAGIALGNHKLSLFGSYVQNGSHVLFVLQIDSSGTWDTVWGNQGFLLLPFSFTPSGIHMDEDGCFYLSGMQNGNVVVAKLLPNGAQDIGFGQNGLATCSTTSQDIAVGLDVVASGQYAGIYAYSRGLENGIMHGQVTKFTHLGLADTGFSGTATGRLSISLPNHRPFYVHAGTFSSSHIYMVGHTEHPTEGNNTVVAALPQSGGLAQWKLKEFDLGKGDGDIATHVIVHPWNPSLPFVAVDIHQNQQSISSALFALKWQDGQSLEANHAVGEEGLLLVQAKKGDNDRSGGLSFQSTKNLIFTGIAPVSGFPTESFATRILLSMLLGHSQTKPQPEWSLYPNPGQGLCFLDLPQNFLGTKLRVFDSSGKCILEAPIDVLPFKIDLSAFGTGTYYIQPEGQKAKPWLMP